MNPLAEQPPLDADEILRRISPQIKKLAYLVRRRAIAQNSFDVDDLYQEGMLAAYQALGRFDPGQGASIDAYLSTCAMGSMRRFIRDKGASIKVPRPIYELASRLMREVDMYDHTASYKRFDEMLEKLETEPKALRQAYDHLFLKMTPLSLDKKANIDDNKTDIYNFLLEEPYDVVHADKLRVVRERLEEFPELYRSMFLMATTGMSQKEIGKHLGYSQMHVSRTVTRIKNALIETREQYDRDGDAI